MLELRFCPHRRVHATRGEARRGDKIRTLIAHRRLLRNARYGLRWDLLHLLRSERWTGLRVLPHARLHRAADSRSDLLDAPARSDEVTLDVGGQDAQGVRVLALLFR